MSADVELSADDNVRRQVAQDIESFWSAVPRHPKEALALAARILGKAGHGSGLAGQITARAPEGGWWTLPLGLAFEEASPDRLVRIDEDVQKLAGDGIANPAVRFHIWVYRARPDVQAIVHTHPPAVSALSMTGRPLVVSHMDATMLWDDCAWLPTWPGPPIGDDEGRIISEALGDKRAVLLAHHGLLTAGASVEEATYLAWFMERAARMQLDAEALGPIPPIEPAYAQAAHDFLVKPEIVVATFDAWARVLPREVG